MVQDASSYQQRIDRLTGLEAMEAIRAGLKNADEGRVKPARKAFGELGRKLGIPR